MVLKGPRQGIELKLYELTLKVLHECKLELYDMEWNPHSGNLIVYIQNPETKTAVLDDCVAVDRGFNPYMETETWIPDNFTLEVSSPGLYRGLSTIEHFKDVIDENVMLHLTKKIDEIKYPEFPKSMRNNLKIKVQLKEVADDFITVDAKGCIITIPFEQIKKANLETEINNNN